jgi:hypothetical protein
MVNIGSSISNSELPDIGNMNKKTLFYQIMLNGLLFQEIKESLNNSVMGTNNLLNISIKFQELKKEHFYWNLNKQYSRYYYTSLPYRERITLLMKTTRQLSLDLNSCSEIVDVSVLADIHTLDLRNCYSILDVSLLGGVYELNLSGCLRVVNVIALGQAYKLNLRMSNVVDVSALGRVHTLKLSHCQRLIDVSALGQVHDLNISYCANIVDVSALGGVHTLNLYDCIGVVDVSALGQVYDLNLGNTNVVDVSALGGVHTLNLSGCQRVVDVSALGQVHDLDLHFGCKCSWWGAHIESIWLPESCRCERIRSST